MPSGSFETLRDHDLRVSDDGLSLELSVTWPRSMTDLKFLHKSEIDFDPKKFKHHPRVLSFRPYLRKLRTKADHKITSICKIPPLSKLSAILLLFENVVSYSDGTELVKRCCM